MSKAEEYYKKILCYNKDLKMTEASPLTHKGVITYLEKFADQEHQSRVNAISDEDIKKQAEKYADSQDRLCAYWHGINNGYVQGFNAHKNKLLKQ